MKMKSLFIPLIAVFTLVTSTAAFEITLNKNGQLRWVDPDFATKKYSVEWSADTESWSNDWESLTAITSGEEEVDVSVPMFYRVRSEGKGAGRLVPDSLVGYTLVVEGFWRNFYATNTSGDETDVDGEVEQIIYVYRPLNDTTATIVNTAASGLNDAWTDVFVLSFDNATGGTFTFDGVDTEEELVESGGTFSVDGQTITLSLEEQ